MELSNQNTTEITMSADLKSLPDAELEQTLAAANDAYRNTASPIMSDERYDQLIAEVGRRNPEHPWLNKVEPEDDFGLGKVRHSRPMLSTSKAYESSDL